MVTIAIFRCKKLESSSLIFENPVVAKLTIFGSDTPSLGAIAVERDCYLNLWQI